MAGKGEKAEITKRLRLSIGLAALLLVGALAFPSGAVALAEHPFLGSFCEPSGIGSAPCAPSFAKPAGIAVDQSSGDLLVIDKEAGILGRFKSNGTPDDFPALGTNMIDGKGTLPCTPPSTECDGTPQNSLSFGSPAELQVAVDNSGGATDGNIYLTQSAAGVVDIFDEDGSFLGQLTASSEGAFEEPCGVAVDPSGNVYVGDYGEPNGAVHKYIPSSPVPATGDNTLNFAVPKPCAVAAGAGPSAGSVFVASYQGVVWKFNGSTGANEGKEEEAIVPGPVTTVTVNPATGRLYTAAGTPFVFGGRAVKEYDASGSEAKLISSIVPPNPIWGIAVSEESGNVHVAEADVHQIEVWGPLVARPTPVTKPASPIGATAATLNGTVNPEGVALEECFFEWGETKTYGNIAPCEEPDAAEVGSGTSPVAVHADISGLEVGSAYHFRLAAANTNNSPEEPSVGLDEAFLTLGPSIKEEKASLITSSGARLSAEVNPNGEETSFLFEYVSQAQFEESVENEESGFAKASTAPEPPGEVGSGSTFKEVGVQLNGLEADTTYHFRIVATTPAATRLGLDETFTTFVANANILPDNRAYELVSPPQKIGEVLPPEPYGIWTGSCQNCLPGVVEGQTAMQASPDGEEVAYEGSPFSGGLAAQTNEYRSKRSPGGWATESLTTPLFSSLEKQGYQAFSADLKRAVIYQIEPALSEEAPIGEEGKSYANLYLRAEDGSLTPLITEAPPNRDAGGQSANRFAADFAGANAGSLLVAPLHHVIFEANDALSEEVPGVAPEAPVIAATERNLYEWADGELRLVNVAPNDPSAAIANTTFGSGRELKGEYSGADFDGAISDDGSHVFFSEKGSGQAYVRIDGEETRKIEDLGKFLLGSADGSKVLLSDGCLYVIEAEGCEEDLTQGQGGFEGILGATPDLSRIYFVDTKELAPGAEEEEPNLYAWNEGTTSFIATLQEKDNEFNGVVQPQVGDWMPSSASRTAQVSPDGRFLAFMSRAPLTGYDNHVRNGNVCRSFSSSLATCFEVFEYRADSEELVCASCNPSGQRPLGDANLALIYRGKFTAGAGFPQPGNLTSKEGRLFFESQDSLTQGDINGRAEDVYEWEPNEVGGCKRAKGCVALISSGQSPNDSMFLDATPSGDDAFFITRERLLAPDKDERLDLYDARVEGGIEELPLPPCGGEPCRAPGTSPAVIEGPASASFTDPGNVHPKKHHKKKHHKKHRHNRGSSR